MNQKLTKLMCMITMLAMSVVVHAQTTFNVLVDDGPLTGSAQYSLRGNQVFVDAGTSDIRVYGDFSTLSSSHEMNQTRLASDGSFIGSRNYDYGAWHYDFVHFTPTDYYAVANASGPTNGIGYFEIGNLFPDNVALYKVDYKLRDASDDDGELVGIGYVTYNEDLSFIYGADPYGSKMNMTIYTGVDAMEKEEGTCIATDANGDSYISWLDKADDKLYLMKVDWEGTPDWTRSYEDTDYDLTPHDIIIDHDGTLTIVGEADEKSTSNFEAFIINLSSDGTSINLQKRYGANNRGLTAVYGVDETDDGMGNYGYVMAGNVAASKSATSSYGYMLKIQDNGTHDWSKSDAQDDFGRLYSVDALSNGYVFAGTNLDFDKSGFGGTKVIRTDASGNVTDCTFGDEQSSGNSLSLTNSSESNPATTTDDFTPATGDQCPYIYNALCGFHYGTPGIITGDGVNWTEFCAGSGCDLDLAVVVVDEKCAGDGGKATINVTGGSSPYTFSLDGAAFGAINEFDLSPGWYSVRVKDDNGCVGEISFEIQVCPFTPIDYKTNRKHATFPGCSDGFISIAPKFGLDPYTVTEDPGNPMLGLIEVGGVWSISNLPPGVYKFKVVDSYGCEKTLKFIIHCVQEWEAIDCHNCHTYAKRGNPVSQNSIDGQLSIYPVPATEFVILDFAFSINTEVKVYIHDLTGKMVKAVNHVNDGQSQTVTIQTGDLSSGTYIINVQTNGQTFRQKLIVTAND